MMTVSQTQSNKSMSALVGLDLKVHVQAPGYVPG